MYSDTLRAHSPAYYDKPNLERTGHIILPESVLTEVMSADRIPEVMLFQVRNRRLGLTVHAGVQSFTTQPGHVCMPWWMMEFLQIQEQETVDVRLITLPTATRALFQPQDSKFLDLPNPKVILEFNLREHRCLTQGTVIPILFNNRTYKLKILKTEPAKAVSTYRADVICDFATPVSEFDHKWNEPDTDSSDDEELWRPKVGRNLKGEVFTEKPKPIRSTFAQREQDRKTKPQVLGVTKIEAGTEILPPKPRASAHAKKPEQSAFVGEGHCLKKKKAAAPEKSEPAPAPAPEKKPETKPEKPNYFKGTPRSLK